jgi:hypothetical protein
MGRKKVEKTLFYKSTLTSLYFTNKKSYMIGNSRAVSSSSKLER